MSPYNNNLDVMIPSLANGDSAAKLAALEQTISKEVSPRHVGDAKYEHENSSSPVAQQLDAANNISIKENLDLAATHNTKPSYQTSCV